jgi:hypothetical protein
MSTLTGQCFCGEIKYDAGDEIIVRAQCHCRDCQYMSGGHPNFIFSVPSANFTYLQGQPVRFNNPNTTGGVSREFCRTCGTHIASTNPDFPGMAMVKVGSLDKPELAGSPDMLIFTKDKQAFHNIPENVTSYETIPG